MTWKTYTSERADWRLHYVFSVSPRNIVMNIRTEDLSKISRDAHTDCYYDPDKRSGILFIHPSGVIQLLLVDQYGAASARFLDSTLIKSGRKDFQEDMKVNYCGKFGEREAKSPIDNFVMDTHRTVFRAS